MNSTSTLNEFLSQAIEARLKPADMDSRLFWELYELMIRLEVNRE